MDKQLILAVAGSGKTRLIIENLNETDRAMLVTYTIANTKNLKDRIIKKFGCIPRNIKVLSFYEFVYSFCCRPFLSTKYKLKGINWIRPHQSTFSLSRGNIAFYLTRGKRLYSNRISMFINTFGEFNDVKERFEKYYDHLYIDEVQDFGGHDFDLLKNILGCNIDITLVGDFFQHTYKTSEDGRTNKNIYNDYGVYISLYESLGVTVLPNVLCKSYRCLPETCSFISNNLGIDIKSHKEDTSLVEFIEDPIYIDSIMKDDSIIKLFYSKHYDYACNSKNWGECKGEDIYTDVCVVLNKTSSALYKKGKLIDSAPLTKNKLYVACTRASGNLYFIEETLLQNYKIIDA